MFKAVVFDYDGTLVDTIPQIYAEYQRVGTKMGLKPIGFPEFKRVIGLPWEQVIRTLWPDADVAAFSKNYVGASEKPRLIGGVNEALLALSKRYRLAILTSRGEKSLKKQFTEVGLDEPLFDAVLHRDNTLHHKPDPRALRQAFDALSVGVAECVYVGDGFVDAECALKAGCRFIGVLTGGLTRADFKSVGVAEVLPSVSEITSVI